MAFEKSGDSFEGVAFSHVEGFRYPGSSAKAKLKNQDRLLWRRELADIQVKHKLYKYTKSRVLWTTPQLSCSFAFLKMIVENI